MSVNQKRAWGNLIVWGLYLVITGTMFAVKGTIFFWQEEALRSLFYAITGLAISGWFVMMLIVWISSRKSAVTTDERDNELMSRVNSACGPLAMTAVAVTTLVLMIIYLEDKTSVISPYFLIYLTIINVVVYWLAQAILTLLAYSRH